MKSINVVVIGDSIAAGADDREGGWPARLRGESIRRSQEEPSLNRYDVINQSVDGATSSSFVDSGSHFLQVTQHLEDEMIFIIALGANDAVNYRANKRPQIPAEDYIQNVAQLSSSLRRKGQVIWLEPTLVEEDKAQPDPQKNWWIEYAANNMTVRQFRRELKLAAHELEVPFISLAALDDDWETTDGIHPTTAMHAKMFNIVLTFLDEFTTED